MPEEPIPSYTIKDVWAHNVEEEFRSIRKLILKYPFVAMVRSFLRRKNKLGIFFRYRTLNFRVLLFDH